MLHDPNQSSLFPQLSETDLQKIAEQGKEHHFADGEILFAQGDLTYPFYIVLSGEVRITKRIGQETRLLTVHGPREFTGDISMVAGNPATVTAEAVGSCQVLELSPEAFRRMIIECSYTAAIMLTAMAGRSEEVGIHFQQQEKLAALGKLSAGLAHELNNPAAAALRAAKQLRELLEQLQQQTFALSSRALSAPQRTALQQVQSFALSGCGEGDQDEKPVRSPLEQSEQEDLLADWLEDRGIADSWNLAPEFATAGINEDYLNKLERIVEPDQLSVALHWLESSLAAGALLHQVEHSTQRISDLIKALKSYAYMDQAPLQEIDIHQSLEDTLSVLHHKLGDSVAVEFDYASDLPKICAYGSELNQVWTNLIDNAIDSLATSKGVDPCGNSSEPAKGEKPTHPPTITIRTSQKSDRVLVEILDNGPGIPETEQSQIFEPFFTTKDVGAGTGLGLDIARRIVVKRHGGSIRVTSHPGKTNFQVCLPLQPPRSSY